MSKKLTKYIKLKIKKFNYIINNFESIVKKKEKQILAKRKEIIAMLNERKPLFYKQLKGSIILGVLLSLVCIIFNLYYSDPLSFNYVKIPEVTEENYPDLKYCKQVFTYDLPQIILIQNQIFIPWLYNNITDVSNCLFLIQSFTPLPIIID